MTFDLLLNLSLILFAIGMIFKIVQWFSFKIGLQAQNSSFSQRLISSLKSIPGVIFSPKFVIILKTFVFEVLFLIKILKQDVLRWIMHMLIFWGFILLFFMHALESIVSEKIFSYYY